MKGKVSQVIENIGDDDEMDYSTQKGESTISKLVGLGFGTAIVLYALNTGLIKSEYESTIDGDKIKDGVTTVISSGKKGLENLVDDVSVPSFGNSTQNAPKVTKKPTYAAPPKVSNTDPCEDADYYLANMSKCGG